MEPFWPRHSPHFLACRRAVRDFDRPAVIGLSGGADSLALVAAAAAEAKDVRAVVVDHGLQAGSAEVAARAAQQARSFGVPARVARVSVADGNVEAAAREARYRALFADGGGDVWVAHTADDQAETLLLGALRGNPSGMATRDGLDGRLVRPFLAVRRHNTVGACAELGIEPWMDPMNEDPKYRRVVIRGEIIPRLSEVIGGDCVDALAKTAHRIAEDRELLDSLYATEATDDCAKLAADPLPILRRRLVAWLHDNGARADGGQLEQLTALVTNWRGQGPINIGGGAVVRRVSGRLVIGNEDTRGGAGCLKE